MNYRETKASLDTVIEFVRSSGAIEAKSFTALTALCPTIIVSTLEILDLGKITRF